MDPYPSEFYVDYRTQHPNFTDNIRDYTAYHLVVTNTVSETTQLTIQMLHSHYEKLLIVTVLVTIHLTISISYTIRPHKSPL